MKLLYVRYDDEHNSCVGGYEYAAIGSRPHPQTLDQISAEESDSYPTKTLGTTHGLNILLQ